MNRRSLSKFALKGVVQSFIVLWILSCIGCTKSKVSTRGPTSNWEVTTPESEGFDSKAMTELLNHYRESRENIHSMLLIRHGKIVLDASFYPYEKGTVHDIASITKSVISVLIGIAIDQGFIESIDQPILRFFKNRPIQHLDASKQRITIWHLLTMSSGLHCGYQSGELELMAMFRSKNWVQSVLDLPMKEEPGQRFVYCSGNSHLLSAILTEATGMSAVDFAKKHLFTPLGIRDYIWPTDPQGITRGWGDLHLYPKDLAKIGFLYLNQGQWAHSQIVSADWVNASTQKQIARSDEEDYGYHWRIHKTGTHAGMFYHGGRGGQSLNIWPQTKLIFVASGGNYGSGEPIENFISSMSRDPLPKVQKNNEALQKALIEIAKPPTATPFSLPAIAQDISGKTYALSPNFLNFQKVSLDFQEQTRPMVTFSYLDPASGKLILNATASIGMGEVYAFSSGRYGLPAAWKGRWDQNGEFLLTFNEIANINVFEFRMRFEGDQVFIVLSERTRLFPDQTIEGVLQD